MEKEHRLFASKQYWVVHVKHIDWKTLFVKIGIDANRRKCG